MQKESKIKAKAKAKVTLKEVRGGATNTTTTVEIRGEWWQQDQVYIVTLATEQLHTAPISQNNIGSWWKPSTVHNNTRQDKIGRIEKIGGVPEREHVKGSFEGAGSELATQSLRIDHV